MFLLLPVFLATTMLAFLTTVGSTFGSPASRFIHSYTDLPLPKALPMPQTTYVYDRQGRVITTFHAGVDRTEVPLRRISKHLQEAVIAVEDQAYYREGGVSIEGILRAALVNLNSGQVEQGGSTITQQYVKNVYTSGERTVSRKIQEAIFAEKLDRVLTKDEILEKYLNSVYFGHGAYGAEAAALTYFGVHAARLSVGQSAVLAGVIRAPATYDPFSNRSAAKARRNLALGAMAEQGYIGPDKADRLAKAPIRLDKPGEGDTEAAYFVDYVRRALQKKYGVPATFTGGLRVTTTLDWDMQRAAEAAIAGRLKSPQDPAAALVAMDPRTGEIRAMVGGRNFQRAKFNLATQARRQTGSAFKVFTLTAAVEKGISPQAVMSGPTSLSIDDPRCLNEKFEPWKVSNYADESAGTMSLLQGTAHSVNTIFAQLVLDVGPKRVANVARRMGIRSPLEPVCSITLGSQGVTPLDMTTAYATLAARGVRRDPQSVRKVVGPDGDVLTRLTPRGKRVLGRNDADLVTEALQGVVTGGTGTAAAIGRPAAGKTGTAQNYQDAWFCGYVPQLAACVWMGYPKTEDRPMENVEGFAHVFGGSLPAGIWHDFMIRAVAGMATAGFPQPSFAGYDVIPERLVSLPPPAPKKPSPSPSPSPSPTCRPTPRCHPKP